MKNLKLKNKMAVLVIIALIALLSVGITGAFTSRQLAERSKKMFQDNLLPVQWTSQIRLNNEIIESDLLSLLLTEDQAANSRLSQDIEEKKANNDAVWKKLSQASLHNAAVTQKLKEYESLLPEFRAKREQIIVFGKANRNNDAYRLYAGEFDALKNKMFTLLSESGSLLQQDAQKQYEGATAASRSVQTLSILIIAAAVLLILLAAGIIIRMIDRPLAGLRKLMAQAEQGDLSVTASYTSKDELGQINQSFNNMIASLSVMLQKVSDSAETLSASSRQMSASAEQTSQASNLIASTASELAAGFDNQVSGIAETNASIQAMAEDIASVKQGSEQMSDLMNKASDSAGEGAEKVARITGQMNEINTSMTESQSIIVSLARLSEEINNIITTINGIAGQTSLLSLNASIEAARAGESGRGFAVVAGEIRKLSEETAKSSLHITDIISQIQQRTGEAVHSMAQGARLAAEGVEASEEVSAAFSQIVGSIQNAINQTESIKKSVAHVSAECADLVDVMDMVNGISQKGAAGVEDVSASSQEQMSAMEEMSGSARYLASIAEELQHNLAGFKL